MKQLFLLIIFSGPFFLTAQTRPAENKPASFSIVKMGTKYSVDLVKTAFEKANMCGYYYENLPNDIVFDDGTVVRLHSKKEQSLNNTLSPSCFRPDSFKQVPGIWSILPSGYLAKGMQAMGTKGSIKKN